MGYESWIEKTSHDKASWILRAPAPDALIQAAHNKERIIDWRALPVLSNAANYNYRLEEDFPELGHVSGEELSPGLLSP